MACWYLHTPTPRNIKCTTTYIHTRREKVLNHNIMSTPLSCFGGATYFNIRYLFYDVYNNKIDNPALIGIFLSQNCSCEKSPPKKLTHKFDLIQRILYCYDDWMLLKPGIYSRPDLVPHDVIFFLMLFLKYFLIHFCKKWSNPSLVNSVQHSLTSQTILSAVTSVLT